MNSSNDSQQQMSSVRLGLRGALWRDWIVVTDLNQMSGRGCLSSRVLLAYDSVLSLLCTCVDKKRKTSSVVKPSAKQECVLLEDLSNDEGR